MYVAAPEDIKVLPLSPVALVELDVTLNSLSPDLILANGVGVLSGSLIHTAP